MIDILFSNLVRYFINHVGPFSELQRSLARRGFEEQHFIPIPLHLFIDSVPLPSNSHILHVIEHIRLLRLRPAFRLGTSEIEVSHTTSFAANTN